MYITLMPVIFAGILNMVFTKTSLYRRYCRPLDGGRCMRDGRRILGDNKTLIGLLSMTVICGTVQVLWGAFCEVCGLTGRNQLYLCRENTPAFNGMAGLLFGLVYMLFELPNSFVKRRLDIAPGKTERGVKGVFFLILDQVDSLFGVVLVLALLSPMSVGMYFFYILLGGFTHIAVNAVLYGLKIRRNL
ncbi:MAG: CDP-archaeol synthase [Acetatifactor muris]|nr:CDP-archaeol synthase [Acetatifactor muris]MCM1525702.1 CDP-archaeol synthase [Bacteroides sp.]